MTTRQEDVPFYRSTRERRLVVSCSLILCLTYPFFHAFGVFLWFDRLYQYTLDNPNRHVTFWDDIRDKVELTREKEQAVGFQCLNKEGPSVSRRRVRSVMRELERVEATADYLDSQAQIDWSLDGMYWICKRRVPLFVRGCHLQQSYGHEIFSFTRKHIRPYCEKQKIRHRDGEALLPPLEGIYPKARQLLESYAQRIETATNDYAKIAWPFRLLMYTWLLLQLAAPAYLIYMLRRRRRDQNALSAEKSSK